jgi:hypothetical protein
MERFLVMAATISGVITALIGVSLYFMYLGVIPYPTM